MQPVYTRAQLQSKKIADLKAIASNLSITPEGDKRVAQNWIDAIIDAQPQPVAPIKPLVEMNGDDCIANGEIIATITSDDELTQTWVVKVDGVEVHRSSTWARSYDYVRWHYKQGTLIKPEIEEEVADYLFHDDPQPKLPVEGDCYSIGNYELRCSQINGDAPAALSNPYAAVWEVALDDSILGEIYMGWNTFWTHTMSLVGEFATPQQAVADLHDSLKAYEQECEEVTPQGYSVSITRNGKAYTFRWVLTKDQILTNLAMDFSLDEINAATFTPLLPEVIKQVEREHKEA